MPDNKIDINVLEFAAHVRELNSGHDGDCVFFYLEHFLKEKGIKIDLDVELRKMYEDE